MRHCYQYMIKSLSIEETNKPTLRRRTTMTSSDISTFEKKHDEITKVCDELRDEVHKLQEKVKMKPTPVYNKAQ